MAFRDGTDPARRARDPFADDGDGDGAELLGTVIDHRYRLEATIGRGGMGLVYRASHLGLRRSVALKILQPSLAASSDVRNRFEREALAVGRIDHPNCVTTYDVGRLPGGALYLAMELLDGRSLSAVLEKEGQVPPPRALHILAHVLRGLGGIHRAGLIHRDIKPENIFLIRQGDDADFAKILDFGIAKPMKGEIDDGVKLTQAGMAFGTPIYMAPEQALGAPMDGRADVYSAAVVAYEMLVGKPPFYSDDKLEVMSMHTAKPVPPMRHLLRKGGTPVPASIEKLILRGLTKKPSERYGSADEFLSAVEGVLDTRDGGHTDIQFERPVTTGSQPLVTETGRVRLAGTVTGDTEEELDALVEAPRDPAVEAGINAAIDEALAKAARESAARAAPGIRRAAPPAVDATIRTPRAPIDAPRATPTPAPVPPPPATPLTRPPTEVEPDLRIRRPRWVLYSVLAGLAIGGGVVAALAFSRPAAPTVEPAPATAAAAAALERGDVEGALQILTRDPAAIADDAAAQRMLAHAQAARSHRPEALAAYARALTLAPELEAEPELRADLRTMAAYKDPAIVADAFELWLGHTKDPAARVAIGKAATADAIERRHAVRAVVARYHADDAVDWLAAYALDLRDEPSCAQRLAVVPKLRALGDPRAVAPLQQAIRREGDTGARDRRVNVCLIDAATEAIGYLNGLAAGSGHGAR